MRDYGKANVRFTILSNFIVIFIKRKFYLSISKKKNNSNLLIK